MTANYLKPRYVVMNENTLGIMRDGSPWLEVLAGILSKGGRNWRDGCTIPGSTDTIRPATLADFDTFRVEAPPNYQTAEE